MFKIACRLIVCLILGYLGWICYGMGVKRGWVGLLGVTLLILVSTIGLVCTIFAGEDWLAQRRSRH